MQHRAAVVPGQRGIGSGSSASSPAPAKPAAAPGGGRVGLWERQGRRRASRAGANIAWLAWAPLQQEGLVEPDGM